MTRVGCRAVISTYELMYSVKAVFVDTDNVPALDSKVGDLVQNETEAVLVHQVGLRFTSLPCSTAFSVLHPILKVIFTTCT